MRGRFFALFAIVAIVSTVGVACGNEKGGGKGGGSGRPGVTSDTIEVGGVVGKTNPVGRPYEDGFAGAEAYFEKVNDEGGVFDHDLELVAKRDDQSRSSANITEIRALVEEDQVFAVLPVVTQIFSGASYLAEQGTPTFGWNINAEWSEGPNLFGEKGSFLCFKCPALHPPYLAQQLGAQRVAIFAYGAATQSADCAVGMRNGFDKYGPPVVFEDTSLQFGFTDLSADVAAVRDNDVDFIATCMDVNGNANIAQALRDAGIEDVSVYSPEGYDQATLDDLGDKLEGFFFGSVFVPFEVEDPPEALQEFLDAMEERDIVPNEQALAGWINATLLVEGIKAAGEDFTQKSVVDAINEMDDFTADGILAGIDWTKSHAADADTTVCTALIQVQNGKFVPVYGEPGKPFVCFEGVNEVDESGAESIDNPIIR